MTQLLDRPTTAGATLYPVASPVLPGVRAAEDFYLRGANPPARQITVQAVGPDGARRKWLAGYVQDQLNALLALGPGWDGHRGRPLTDAAVQSAVAVLFAVADDLSVPPQVFPLPDGGVQLEWHAGESVEIEVNALGEAHVLAIDATGAIVINHELAAGDEDGLARVRQSIAELSARLTGAR